MRVHWLQHVPFEGLGSIAAWLDARGADVAVSRLFADPRLPGAADFDWLIIMGGPMSVNDGHLYPWLDPEKRLIAEALESGRTVVGVCLGAQLIASAMGARVHRSTLPEIGWFPVSRTQPAEAPWLPATCDAFHWHGETFDLPAGAVRIARSEACENQGFVVGPRVVGLQFHLEATPGSAAALVEAGRKELAPGRFVQSEKEILAPPERFRRINGIMESLLDSLNR